MVLRIPTLGLFWVIAFVLCAYTAVVLVLLVIERLAVFGTPAALWMINQSVVSLQSQSHQRMWDSRALNCTL